MRVRLVVDRSGTRWDGQDWPARGGEIDVPDDEGAALCEHGIAVPVAVTEKDAEIPETAAAADEEQRSREAPQKSSGAAEGTSGPAAAAPEPAKDSSVYPPRAQPRAAKK